MTHKAHLETKPMIMQKDSTRQLFFELLRSGLWNKPLSEEFDLSETAWKEIFCIATQQAVWGLTTEALFHLRVTPGVSLQVLQRLHYLLSCNRTHHARLNQALAEIVALLEERAIPTVLFKGQGVATYYPDPTLRICGDIDLYIGPEHYTEACHIVQKWGKADTEPTESVKHYQIIHRDVTIELHRIAEKLPDPRQNQRFQTWTRQMLQPTLCRRVRIGDADIAVPPADFEVLYIFNHAYQHFVAGGIGLRQLCDWVLALHRFHGEIHQAQLQHNLKTFGLWRVWRIFGCIAVDTLGLPEAEFPFYDATYRREAERILEQIFIGGNFGWYDPAKTPRPTGYIAGKWHTVRMMHRRYYTLLPLIPREILRSQIDYLWTGIKHVIKDLSTTK
ncbi:MAG: nucleotidyltransferase family protein [Alistipes sp.]|nr:nucleotidyltransferase family protein [Alistipes sp.]